MNKGLSKAMLGIVTGTMIATCVYLGFANKDESKVVDVYGNKEALGDVSIVYQQREGFYKTKEVSITKDNHDVNKYVKELSTGYTISRFNRENRDLLKYATPDYNTLYQDDKKLGYVQISRDYTMTSNSNDKVQLIVYVTEKDLENNKISEYKIPLDFYDKSNASSDDRVIPIKYNNELYIITSIDYNADYVNSPNNEVYGAKESRISVFKLNLEEETSEHILTKEIATDDELISNSRNICFSYNDTAYFLSFSYKLNEKNNYERKIEFLTYNVSNGKFETVDLPLNISDDHGIHKYNIEGNILTLVAQGENDYGNLDFEITKINLDNNEIILNSDKYKMSVDDNNEFSYVGIEDFRIIDNNVYLTMGAYEDTEATQNSRGTGKQYLAVMDEKTKDTLYIGKIEESEHGYIYPTIVKEDEL